MPWFILYLLLAVKPRYDDSNEVARYRDVEHCQAEAALLNEIHQQQTNEHPPMYIWECKEEPR